MNKQHLLELAQKEFATTIKVLKAFPEDKIDFKPQGRGRSIKDIAKTFVFEMYLFDGFLFGEEMDNSKFKTYAPENLKVLVEDFEKQTQDFVKKFEKLDESELEKTVEFAGKQWSKDEFALMMIHDQIHHRGQLTVYIRLAEGKVPSIYGPSEDDKETNL